MDTTNEGQCPHDQRCHNCLGDKDKEHNHTADARRCPSRLEMYGTAQENDHQARKSDNPWIKVKSRKIKPKAQATTGNGSIASNRFEVLDPSPTPPYDFTMTPTPAPIPS